MKEQGHAVLGFCMRMMRTQARAEDARQQVFLEAYRDLDRFEGRSSARTWLFAIARNRCLDLLRAEQRDLKRIESNEQVMSEIEDPGSGPTEQAHRARLVAALEACLERVSPDVRATILMRFTNGMTYGEMAEALEATPAALQVRVSRALPVLRRCMESKGWTGE